MFRKIVYVIVSVSICLTIISDAEAKQGFYMGLGAAYNTIQGDFNGRSGLKSATDVIILPKIDNAVGVDVRAGYGINDAWAIEFNLMVSEHDGTWAAFHGDVNFVSFSVNGKYNFAPSDMTQPYILFGIGGNRLLIKKGSENTSTRAVDDATLSGPGIKAGVGLDQYISPHVSLTLGVLYRYVEYTEAKGANQSGTIDDGVDGSGVSFMLTTAYHF
jgi:opacity protein-like surface antigen